MSAPALSQFIQGLGSVTGDNLNTFLQGCDTLAQLRAYVGAVGQQVYARGGAAVADGGQGMFYWDATSTALDNNTNIIAPPGAGNRGRWIRIADTTPPMLFKMYATAALMNADTTQPLGTLAEVYADPTSANNQFYNYTAGGWVAATWFYNLIRGLPGPPGPPGSPTITFEALGAPTTGAIFTGVLTAGVLTTSTLQSGAITAGMTLTAAGGTGAVTAGTTIVSGSGSTWQTNGTQTLGSTVMVANDSWPYIASALVNGSKGILFTGPHWFSQCIVATGYPIRWYGPQGYSSGGNGYPAKWYFPSGYGGFVAVPTNLTVNAQGDVTLAGNAPFGGIEGSSFERITVQAGNGSLPAATVNHRPVVAAYSNIKWDGFQFLGGDGDGCYIFGNGPTCIADKCAFRNGSISNCYDHGMETSGGDANVCDFTNTIISVVGGRGVYEHGFLGNNYRGMQVQNTGQINVGVWRSNNIYTSLIDNNLNNDPLTSPNDWYLLEPSTHADTWSSLVTYRIGAGFSTSGGGNRSEFYSCYSEGGTPPSMMQAKSGNQFITTTIGGFPGIGVVPNAEGNFLIDGKAQMYQFLGYAANTYAYDTTGGNNDLGGFIGYRANNIANGPAVFDAQLSGEPWARFGGQIVPGTHRGAYISAWTAAPAEVQMQYWDATALLTAPFTDDSINDGSASLRWASNSSVVYHPGAGAVVWTSGTGSPNTVVTAPVGSLYTNTGGGAATTLYVKETGAGNTGWVAK